MTIKDNALYPIPKPLAEA